MAYIPVFAHANIDVGAANSTPTYRAAQPQAPLRMPSERSHYAAVFIIAYHRWICLKMLHYSVVHMRKWDEASYKGEGCSLKQAIACYFVCVEALFALRNEEHLSIVKKLLFNQSVDSIILLRNLGTPQFLESDLLELIPSKIACFSLLRQAEKRSRCAPGYYAAAVAAAAATAAAAAAAAAASAATATVVE
ncbi:unnamed protein product [Toxocara canis]|uniref:Uncharacterized protein n=1 Tax=Toxocara canis TaxID=6265 RepID=A0A183VB98_TOXCA|nr:unnamed protein product [Toxocara canis]